MRIPASMILGQVSLAAQRRSRRFGHAGRGIGRRLIGERELKFGIPAGDMLPMGSERLGEAIVEKYAARAADPIENAVKPLCGASGVRSRPMSRGILVEPERHEVAHEPAGLRFQVV